VRKAAWPQLRCMENAAFRTLLKSLCAGLNSDEKTLGDTAGIRRHRIYELAAGRCKPTNREVEQILTAAAITTDMLEQLPIDNGGVSEMELSSRIRAAACQSVDFVSAIQSATLKIDELSVVANTKSRTHSARRRLEKTLTRLGFTSVPNQKVSRSLARIYETHFYIAGLGVGVQLDPLNKSPNARSLRLELTRFTSRAVRAAKDVLSMVDLENHEVTRIDAAIDVDVPFGSLQLVPNDRWKKALFKRTWFRGAGVDREETYFGAAGFESEYEFYRSENVVRVYDWGARHDDLATTTRIGGSRTLRTRIEAEIRRGHKRQMRFEDIEHLPNPFCDLTFFALPDDRTLSYTDQMLVRECAFLGARLVMSRLSPAELRRTRKLLAPSVLAVQPHVAFEKRWTDVVRQLLRQLKIPSKRTSA
jgi:hypothetical protein